MIEKPLSGKKIAVIVENKFIPDEIEAYRNCFTLLGAQVDFISRIWYGNSKPASVTFYSDVDPLDSPPWQSPQPLTVSIDVSSVNRWDYAAIIMCANYTSVRLRWDDIPVDFDPYNYVKQPPVVELFAEIMADKRIVKGALCHGLWILTPNPQLLKGRKVICHSVIMADILNCGAEIVLNDAKVVTDEDLVTGFSKHEVLGFISAITEQIIKIQKERS